MGMDLGKDRPTDLRRALRLGWLSILLDLAAVLTLPVGIFLTDSLFSLSNPVKGFGVLFAGLGLGTGGLGLILGRGRRWGIPLVGLGAGILLFVAWGNECLSKRSW